MFEAVRTFLSRKNRPEAAAPAVSARSGTNSFERLDQVAPLMHPGGPKTASAQTSFVCREAVLNRTERIAGYEFSLERGLRSRFMDERDAARRVSDDLLVRSLASFGVDQLLGHRLAFVDVSPGVFLNPRLEALPVDNTVLMLQVPEAVPIEPLQLLVQIKALKEKGFRIGWRLRLSGSELPVVFEHCDFLQVMTREFDGLQLSDIVTKARAATRPGAQALELIASDIATGDDFQLCFRAGFDFFQGPFVTSRENWHPPKSELDRTQVIQILNRLRSGAQSNELANALKRDPVLTYKMLRYVNAPAMGLRKTITEIEQALVILGRDQLYRWLSLLLFDVKSAGFAERALFEQALVRARLMEQIALRCGLPAALAEQLFLTGLFSLLDQMMGQTISQILEKVAVADKVREALLGDQGLFAPFLRLGKACESGQPEEIALLAAACNVDPNTVNQELINALTWANAVGEIGT